MNLLNVLGGLVGLGGLFQGQGQYGAMEGALNRQNALYDYMMKQVQGPYQDRLRLLAQLRAQAGSPAGVRQTALSNYNALLPQFNQAAYQGQQRLAQSGMTNSSALPQFLGGVASTQQNALLNALNSAQGEAYNRQAGLLGQEMSGIMAPMGAIQGAAGGYGNMAGVYGQQSADTLSAITDLMRLLGQQMSRPSGTKPGGTKGGASTGGGSSGIYPWGGPY